MGYSELHFILVKRSKVVAFSDNCYSNTEIVIAQSSLVRISALPKYLWDFLG